MLGLHEGVLIGSTSADIGGGEQDAPYEPHQRLLNRSIPPDGPLGPRLLQPATADKRTDILPSIAPAMGNSAEWLVQFHRVSWRAIHPRAHSGLR